MAEKKPLSNLVKYTYGLVDLTATIHNNIGNMFFMFVMTNVLMLSNTTTLWISGIGSSIVMFFPFFIGMIMSGTPAMKWGRYRSWLLVCAPIANIAFVFRFVAIGENEVAVGWVILIAHLIDQLFHGFCYAANGSLMNVISSNEADRVFLSRNRGFHTGLANVVISYIGQPLALAFAAKVGLKGGWACMVVCVAVVNCLTMWYTVWLTREYEGPGIAEDVSNTTKRAPISVMLKSLVQNRSLMALVFADICRFTGNMAILGSQAYLFTYVLQDKGLMTLYTFWGGILQTVGSFCSGSVVKKSSAKVMITASEFLCVASLAVCYVASGAGIVPLAIGTLLLYRFSHGFGYSIYFNSYADCVVYGEWKTGMFIPGFTVSLTSVAAQVGSMIKSWVLPLVLIAINFNAKIPVEETSATVISGIRTVVTLFPGGVRLLGALALLIFYNLTNEKIKQCEEEIKARKAGQ